MCESIACILCAASITAAFVEYESFDQLPVRPEGVILVLRGEHELDAAVACVERCWPGPKIVLVASWCSARIRPRSSLIRHLDISAPVDRIVSAVNRALEGTPASAAGYAPPENNATRPHFGVLTAREREVLTFLGEGRSPVQIAHRMGVAENTVRAHLANLRAKLGVRTQLEAVRLVHRPVSAMAPPWTR